MRKLKIGGAALNQVPLDWNNNISNIKNAIAAAKDAGVKILCLPELCLTGYSCEDFFLSDWLPEKALQKIPEIAEACEAITVSVGLPIKYNGQLYNTACVIKNKEILGFTAKHFLANDGVHYETRWFKSWPIGETAKISLNGSNYTLGDLTYFIDDINIAFEICEDAWRGDDLRPGMRHCKKLDKLDLILNPSASHFAFGKTKTRENEVVIHGSEIFNCTYLYVNLLGNESGRIIYDGEILIAQSGRLIQRNNKFSFQDFNLVTAEIDFDDVENSSKDPLSDDPQEKESEFAEAVCLALFDYLRKSKSQGFVISMSGGADSSVCAVLIAEMLKRSLAELGVEKFIEKIPVTAIKNYLASNKITPSEWKELMPYLFFGAYQSTDNSSYATFLSAKLLVEEINGNFYNWDISSEVENYTSKLEKAMGIKLNWENHDITLQNIQARTRSPIIWMMANLKNSLLITTSNRSEGDVGYATMDGDTSGSIAPIAGIDKAFVRYWLLFAENNLGYHSLKNVNTLQPSAELRPNSADQTDENDLMPYPILLEIERCAIKERLHPIEVYKQLKGKELENELLLHMHIKKFYALWSRNQWKRERLAPSFHLDDFNIDPKTWCRFPILNSAFTEELKELDFFVNGQE